MGFYEHHSGARIPSEHTLCYRYTPPPPEEEDLESTVQSKDER